MYLHTKVLKVSTLHLNKYWELNSMKLWKKTSKQAYCQNRILVQRRPTEVKLRSTKSWYGTTEVQGCSTEVQAQPKLRKHGWSFKLKTEHLSWPLEIRRNSTDLKVRSTESPNWGQPKFINIKHSTRPSHWKCRPIGGYFYTLTRNWQIFLQNPLMRQDFIS